MINDIRSPEYEKIASEGGPMPEGLTFPDQILFLGLRTVYHQLRSGIIYRHEAARNRRMLLQEYENNKNAEDLYNKWSRLVRETELANSRYRKNRTLKNADDLVDIFDGFKKWEDVCNEK